MDAMSPNLEAEVAMLHVAGGAARLTPPPGTLALAAPRRAARGRSGELFFITLGLRSPGRVPPGVLEHLAQLAAQAYFGTPGSVTAALREAAIEVNDHLMDLNHTLSEAGQLQGRMMAAVLRGQDLYMAQCGVGQAILVRPSQVSRLTSDEAANRPLGISRAPNVRYHHLQVQPDDLLVLTTCPPPLWSDPTLSGLSGLTPEQVVDRLGAASQQDLMALVVRLKGAPAASAPSLHTAPGAGQTMAVQEPRRPARRAREPDAPRAPSRLRTSLAAAGERLQASAAAAGQALLTLLERVAPGISTRALKRRGGPGTFPPALLAATAVAVPLIVVAIASVVYLREGKGAQFQDYLAQARSAMASAQAAADPAAARATWQQALELLDKAEAYRQTEDSAALRQQAQQALDALDLVIRLEFRPAVSGGFGPNSTITALAATASDLYVLDQAHQQLWHAWATGRGYEIDSDFECLDGPDSIPGMATPVGLSIQPEPGALGTEGVVAMDADGTVLYCAPGVSPATSQLSAPEIGWGRIQAFNVFNDRLYVLDPEANAVWIYDARGGLFSGAPTLYFAEEVPDLSQAIDLVKTQDELILLYAGGNLNRCTRVVEPTAEGRTRIRINCDSDVRFQDERPGVEASSSIPGATPVDMAYSPPPEPSLFFLDARRSTVYHYSMRLVYQGQYQPLEPFQGAITAMTLGPPNDLFLAAGNQVYFAQTIR